MLDIWFFYDLWIIWLRSYCTIKNFHGSSTTTVKMSQSPMSYDILWKLEGLNVETKNEQENVILNKFGMLLSTVPAKT